MTKLEQVARAIAAARFGTTVDRMFWSSESHAWQQAHIDMARAAVEALREPTDEMIVMGDDGGSGRCIAGWHAMLDAILSEKPE